MKETLNNGHSGQSKKRESKLEEAIAVFFSFSLVCAAVIMLLIVQGAYSQQNILSFRKSPLEWTLYTVIPLTGILLLGVILVKRLSSKHIDDANKNYQHLSLMKIVGFMFSAALFEELLFRGLIQNGLLLLLKKEWLAIPATALLFLAFHVQYYKKPLMLLNITVPALVFGWVYAETGNILVPFVIHFLSNLLMTLFFKYDWLKLKA
ncbi:CPBP family intramembrane glutamic endopeptidase [Fontibacillus sp. BL9]|uniref:CPBP family intramembrane glutamic endopeptidase n=1 Tax=Fontibacillus sp. BL9 TaxID=3389971 RepID=UPI0039781ACD